MSTLDKVGEQYSYPVAHTLWPQGPFHLAQPSIQPQAQPVVRQSFCTRCSRRGHLAHDCWVDNNTFTHTAADPNLRGPAPEPVAFDNFERTDPYQLPGTSCFAEQMQNHQLYHIPPQAPGYAAPGPSNPRQTFLCRPEHHQAPPAARTRPNAREVPQMGYQASVAPVPQVYLSSNAYPGQVAPPPPLMQPQMHEYYNQVRGTQNLYGVSHQRQQPPTPQEQPNVSALNLQQGRYAPQTAPTPHSHPYGYLQSQPAQHQHPQHAQPLPPALQQHFLPPQHVAYPTMAPQQIQQQAPNSIRHPPPPVPPERQQHPQALPPPPQSSARHPHQHQHHYPTQASSRHTMDDNSSPIPQQYRPTDQSRFSEFFRHRAAPSNTPVAAPTQRRVTNVVVNQSPPIWGTQEHGIPPREPLSNALPVQLEDDPERAYRLAFSQLAQLQYLHAIGQTLPPAPRSRPPPRTGVPAHVQLPEFEFSPECDISETICVVCQCDFAAGEIVQTTPCVHNFHKDCVAQWFQEKNFCPTCREVVDG
eukprot:TRINITY_DN15346_c0_g1_i1.p1 TRINITY_DN15346_c0_g1~~TRINITY_DN15346_c0_g1_i1.p1  ORF type:complete len:529 (+),score=38.42 TRINITY_DN15346_c0_g1_i1:139-1725(+)